MQGILVEPEVTLCESVLSSVWVLGNPTQFISLGPRDVYLLVNVK